MRHQPKKPTSDVPTKGLTSWELFFENSALEIFEKGGVIRDIGGGLRISSKSGNKFDEKRFARFSPFLNKPTVDYKITDVTDTYSADEVEDLQTSGYLVWITK